MIREIDNIIDEINVEIKAKEFADRIVLQPLLKEAKKTKRC